MASAQIDHSRKDRIKGCTVHSVIDESGKQLGWIDEVFSDVFYVKHFDAPYKDNTRYRKLDAALAAIAA